MEVKQINRRYNDRNDEQPFPPPWKRIVVFANPIVGVVHGRQVIRGICAACSLIVTHGRLEDFWGIGSITSSLSGIALKRSTAERLSVTAQKLIARKQMAKITKATWSKTE
jgi:hypothetical protein